MILQQEQNLLHPVLNLNSLPLKGFTGLAGKMREQNKGYIYIYIYLDKNTRLKITINSVSVQTNKVITMKK